MSVFRTPDQPSILNETTVALSSLVPPAALPPHTYCPPYLHRVGFSLAFGIATWAFGVGDERNGTGIATGAFCFDARRA